MVGSPEEGSSAVKMKGSQGSGSKGRRQCKEGMGGVRRRDFLFKTVPGLLPQPPELPCTVV